MLFVHLVIDWSYKFADRELSHDCDILFFCFVFAELLSLFEFVKLDII